MNRKPHVMKQFRGDEPPIARNTATLDEDLDVLDRRSGELKHSATKVEDLTALGVVTQTTQGSYSAAPTSIQGGQNLNNFLKRYQ